MSGFSGDVTGMNNLDDVFFNAIGDGQMVAYNGTTSKWLNKPISDHAALSKQGGQEAAVFAEGVSGTYNVNLANANVFRIGLTGNTTLTFTGAVSGKACAFTLYVKQDGAGNRKVTWPAGVKWAGGTPAVASTNGGAVDIFVFESTSGDSSWYGSLVGLNFS